MPVDIAELRELLGKATKRPWEADQEALASRRHGDTPFRIYAFDGSNWFPITQHWTDKVDARLACAAVNALPELLDELEAARAEVERLQARIAADGAGS